jgi:hypothetical protein
MTMADANVMPTVRTVLGGLPRQASECEPSFPRPGATPSRHAREVCDLGALRAKTAHLTLVLRETTLPEPGPGEVRIAIEACAVCRTDLHVVDGELPDPALPIVPGHQIAGRAGTRATKQPR